MHPIVGINCIKIAFKEYLLLISKLKIKLIFELFNFLPLNNFLHNFFINSHTTHIILLFTIHILTHQ